MTFPSDVPVEYRALNKYLRERPADIIVLRLIEIEDLLGSKLPAPARLQLEWWATADAGHGSPQSRAWTESGRTATPNLRAQTVMFERERG
jgi:hypothetical protein